MIEMTFGIIFEQLLIMSAPIATLHTTLNYKIINYTFVYIPERNTHFSNNAKGFLC